MIAVQTKSPNKMDNRNLCIPHALSWALGGHDWGDFTLNRHEFLIAEGIYRLTKMKRARLIRRSFTTSTGIVVSSRNDSDDPKNFEGPLEMAFYISCDFDRTVKAYRDQPCEITFKDPTGKSRSYFPDTLVWFNNHGPGKKRKPLLVEVKKAESIKSEGELHEWQTAAGNNEALVQGWDYTVLTEAEIYTPFWRNAKFLRRFGDFHLPDRSHSAHTTLLRSLLTVHGPQTIDALLTMAAASLGEGRRSTAPQNELRVTLMPVLYSLICRWDVFVNLKDEVTLQSVVKVPSKGDIFYSPFR